MTMNNNNNNKSILEKLMSNYRKKNTFDIADDKANRKKRLEEPQNFESDPQKKKN